MLRDGWGQIRGGRCVGEALHALADWDKRQRLPKTAWQ